MRSPASPFLSGDANGDGTVDINDLTIVLANYNQTTGMTWSTGDFIGDGTVDINDLTICWPTTATLPRHDGQCPRARHCYALACRCRRLAPFGGGQVSRTRRNAGRAANERRSRPNATPSGASGLSI